MTHRFRSYAAIGDSFAEGLGDLHASGAPRGWADLVAQGLAAATTQQVSYVNLAIRGKLLSPLLDEQLAPALALKPDLLSISGGNNDVIRPRVSIQANTARLKAAIDQAADAGTHVLFVTVANMTHQLPLGRLIQIRGDRYAHGVQAWQHHDHVTVVDNWFDTAFHDPQFWAADKLHLNTRGHYRVATKVLTALNVTAPTWPEQHLPPTETPSSRTHFVQHVIPWIGRRLRGRSSGDGRPPKQGTLLPVDPTAASPDRGGPATEAPTS
ncbi:GDSL-type esterase/lipase family protein [Frigoribacterium endophyticum]|uniref:GDSL-type esterase/lipase family protein n=1 Tax=Frigoribacterium endophyticum TaxID=1522176 RepID=UPI0014217073|nr:lysophospholipase L1-like esterase [Frigoribacterium endophyticum]